MMRDDAGRGLIARGHLALHAWLDGDGSVMDVRRSGETGVREVALWSRVDAEAARRREVRAPDALRARIMAALPGGDSTATEPAAPMRAIGLAERSRSRRGR